MKQSKRHTIPQSPVQLGRPDFVKLLAEWQQRGPETLSGHGVRKLRLAFATTQPAITARVAV